jgi:hypothetical protein
LRFIPDASSGGGSRIGNSYISDYATCPRNWFNRYYYPHYDPTGELLGRGLQPALTALPLLSGRLFHETIAAWYESGCRDGEDTGEYSVDHALDVGRTHWVAARSEYTDEQTHLDDWTMIQALMRGYHDRYGPNAYARDWPALRVQCDGKGAPLVEREWLMDLGYGDYVYTCRTDLLVSDHGYLRVMEHKTTKANQVWRYKQNLNTNTQFTGECYVLAMMFPDEPVNGVLLNCILKDRGHTSKYDVAERDSTTRTPAQFERWRLETLAVLREIDTQVERFEGLIADGMDFVQATDQCFPTRGTRTGRCHAFNRPCDYYDMCRLPGLEPSLLRSFRSRTKVELETVSVW